MGMCVGAIYKVIELLFQPLSIVMGEAYCIGTELAEGALSCWILNLREEVGDYLKSDVFTTMWAVGDAADEDIASDITKLVDATAPHLSLTAVRVSHFFRKELTELKRIVIVTILAQLDFLRSGQGTRPLTKGQIARIAETGTVGVCVKEGAYWGRFNGIPLEFARMWEAAAKIQRWYRSVLSRRGGMTWLGKRKRWGR